jgi:hypothetical protein
VSETISASAAPLQLGGPVIEVDHLEVNFKGRVGLFAGLMVARASTRRPSMT